jgi:hypothetical protein
MWIVRTETESFPYYSYEKALENMEENDSIECVVLNDPGEIEIYL